VRFLRYEGIVRNGIKGGQAEKGVAIAPQARAASNIADPLDRELADPPAIVGKRGRLLLWTIGLMALALRFLLMPLGHWWDLTIDYNVFIDLAHNHSPYETFSYMSNIARSSGWDRVYEYYAYPPVPLYIYYPLAKLYILLHPQAQYFFAVSGTNAVPNLSVDFFFLFKLPIWIADFLIAAMLARMSGTIRGWRDYLLNPYVLLVSGAWTFDAIMLLGLVAGIYFVYRKKVVWAGIALAFGTMVKFFPAIAVPTILIYMIKKNRPVREIVLFLLAYVVACLVFLGPFAQGVISVATFHGNRAGGGMTWQYIWQAGALYANPEQIRENLGVMAVFGMPMLIISMLLAYWYIWQRDLTLNQMMILTLLGFFIGSKLINEQYALLIFPFLWLEAYRAKGIWTWFYRAYWIIPLVFATFHVPIDRFLWLFYHMVFKARADATIIAGATGFEWPMIPWKHPGLSQLICLVLGFTFVGLSIAVFFWPTQSPRRLKRAWSRITGTNGAEPRDENTETLEQTPQGPVEVLPAYIDENVSTSVDR
jgi:hypothetical protein